MWSVVRHKCFFYTSCVLSSLYSLFMFYTHSLSFTFYHSHTLHDIYIYIMVSQLTQTMLGDICRRQRKEMFLC